MKQQIRGFCYLCGRKTASAQGLKWHVEKCREQWQNDFLRRPADRSIAPPKAPSIPMPSAPGALLEAWNREAARIFLQVRHAPPRQTTL